MNSAETDPWFIPPRYWQWIGQRSTVVLMLWIVCFFYGFHRLYHARTEFGNNSGMPTDMHRADGNGGHTQIDFGGQWVMGRMVYTGHQRQLYHRSEQWKLVWTGYPIEGESPYTRRNAFPILEREPDALGSVIKHDAEWLMFSFMGNDSEKWDDVASLVALAFVADSSLIPNPIAAAGFFLEAQKRMTPEIVNEVNQPKIGGPLYPPVHGFLYAPIGAIDEPQRAYFLFQFLSFLMTFFAGYGIKLITRGRIWWSVATLLIFTYPGYRSGLDLAQNQVLTLTILVWGWVFATRGQDQWGGIIWGLLAFKPVWAVAFFLVPLLMGRWRFCLAMGLTGAVLALLTIPFVGIQAWFDWLDVGKEASAIYAVNKNWIGLSRDLSGIPRRLLIDFTLPEAERKNPIADLAGWGLWAAVLIPTIGVYWWRGHRKFCTGLGAGFLLLGAYLCCYRFMYYDVLLSVLPLIVLFADPKRYLNKNAFEIQPGVSQINEKPLERGTKTVSVLSQIRGTGWFNSFPLTVIVLMLFIENFVLHLSLEATFGIKRFATIETVAGGGTTQHIPRLNLDLNLFQAWETFLLLLLWGWCLIRLLLQRDWGDTVQETPRSLSNAAPMSGERISDSPTSTA